MDKLVFKSFTWPENPARYAVEATRAAEYDENDTFTGLGALHRTITGSGEFVGSEAYASFKALLALMDTTSGTLTHPVWGSCTAFLTELTLRQEPVENYVAYTFTFREADSTGGLSK